MSEQPLREYDLQMCCFLGHMIFLIIFLSSISDLKESIFSTEVNLMNSLFLHSISCLNSYHILVYSFAFSIFNCLAFFDFIVSSIFFTFIVFSILSNPFFF